MIIKRVTMLKVEGEGPSRKIVKVGSIESVSAVEQAAIKAALMAAAKEGCLYTGVSDELLIADSDGFLLEVDAADDRDRWNGLSHDKEYTDLCYAHAAPAEDIPTVVPSIPSWLRMFPLPEGYRWKTADESLVWLEPGDVVAEVETVEQLRAREAAQKGTGPVAGAPWQPLEEDDDLLGQLD